MILRLPPQTVSPSAPTLTLVKVAPLAVSPSACPDYCAGLTGAAYEMCMQVCLQDHRG